MSLIVRVKGVHGALVSVHLLMGVAGEQVEVHLLDLLCEQGSDLTLALSEL